MHDNEKSTTFAPELISNDAQMAESVDALVSNTSGATHPGSTPGLGTKRGTKVPLFFVSLTLICRNGNAVRQWLSFTLG